MVVANATRHIKNVGFTGGGVPYIYIYIRARCLLGLFNHDYVFAIIKTYSNFEYNGVCMHHNIILFFVSGFRVTALIVNWSHGTISNTYASIRNLTQENASHAFRILGHY